MEHSIIITDGRFQKITGVLVKGRSVLRVLLIQNTVSFFLICAVAENRCNTQFLGWVCCHLLLKFLIIQFCHWHRCHSKNRIKSAKTLLLLDFFYRATLGGCHFFDIREGIENIGLISTISFLIKMFQNIIGYKGYTFWSHHCLFAVDIPHHLIINGFICVHCLNVIYSKWKNIFIIDCIHNGISM